MAGSRRRFLLALLAAAGAPVALFHRVPATDSSGTLRAAESLSASLTTDQPEEPMKNKTRTSLALVAATLLLVAGIVIGFALSRTPTPGDDPALAYAAELRARGAGQGSTVAELANYLTSGRIAASTSQ